jgi:hypothetical protein
VYIGIGDKMGERLKLNRSVRCRLCGHRRTLLRVGRKATELDPWDDPDYAVMVCPTCDTP